MIVLICADSVRKTMSHYLRQLAAEDIEAVVGAPDRAFGHDERNWLPRLEWQRNRLWELDPDEKVVMSDGWDVLFQGTREQVEKLFPAEGQILIGGEKNCWPDDEAQIHYPMGPTPWMFCNARTIAGRAGDLLKALLKGRRGSLPRHWGLKISRPTGWTKDSSTVTPSGRREEKLRRQRDIVFL